MVLLSVIFIERKLIGGSGHFGLSRRSGGSGCEALQAGSECPWRRCIFYIVMMAGNLFLIEL